MKAESILINMENSIVKIKAVAKKMLKNPDLLFRKNIFKPISKKISF